MNRPFRLVLPLLALAALPLRAAEPPKGEPAVKPFETAQLAVNAWYGRFGMTNCAWLDLGDGVLLVDTAGTPADTANLQAEIKRTTNKPVKWIVLTQLHADANGGLPSLLPADVTIFANQEAATNMALALAKKSAPGKQVTVVGVTDRLFLVFGTHPIEMFVPRGPAQSAFDLVAYAPELRTAFVGDLVTGGRCPMMSDPSADPKTWNATLDRILALQPAVLVPTRGDAAVRTAPKVTTGGLNLDNEVQATRVYIERLLKILKEEKKKKAPEPAVSSALRLAKVSAYCPTELDAINALALYRRLTPQGDFRQPAIAGAKAAPKPHAKPSTKKKP